MNNKENSNIVLPSSVPVGTVILASGGTVSQQTSMTIALGEVLHPTTAENIENNLYSQDELLYLARRYENRILPYIKDEEYRNLIKILARL